MIFSTIVQTTGGNDETWSDRASCNSDNRTSIWEYRDGIGREVGRRKGRDQESH